MARMAEECEREKYGAMMIRMIIFGRRLLLAMLMIITILILAGCDEGLRITRMEIANYPSNIVYVIGENSRLDMSGGQVKLITADGHSGVVAMNEQGNRITSDVDFTTPGVYSVTISRANSVRCEFPVQVVQSCVR